MEQHYLYSVYHTCTFSEGALICGKTKTFCMHDAEVTEGPAAGSWVLVEVTCISDPAHFYITCPLGTNHLMALVLNDQPPGTSYVISVNRVP